MKNLLINKIKLFIVITLAVVAAGMFVLGFVGFNNTVDFKTSYQVVIDVEEDISGSVEIAKTTAESFFDAKDIDYNKYTVETTEYGKIIYKFETDVTAKIDGLEAQIQTKLDAEGLKIEANVDASKVTPYVNKQVGSIALASGVALVVCLVYLLIMEKLSGALSVLGSSLISGLLFVALLAVTRIPALPFAVATASLTAMASAILSLLFLGRVRGEIKNVANDKLSNAELSKKATQKTFIAWIVTIAFATVSAILLIAIGTGYLKFLGLQVLIAGLSATFGSFVWTPMIWSATRKQKKNKSTAEKE